MLHDVSCLPRSRQGVTSPRALKQICAVCVVSYLPRKPAYAADDTDLVCRALVGGVERVVGDHPHRRRVAVGYVFEALGGQAHAVVENEDAGRAGELARHVNQHGVAVLQRGEHAVAFDMHDPEL